jgi:hypothetical protein
MQLPITDIAHGRMSHLTGGLAIVGLVVVLILGACSGSTADEAAISPIAAEVLNRVEAVVGPQEQADPTEPVAPEGCRFETQLDEYDFEVQVIVCDDDPEPTTSTEATESTEATDSTEAGAETPRGLLEWAGSDDARQVALVLRKVLIEQTGCDHPQDLIALANLLTAMPIELQESFAAAIQDLQRSADLCNADVSGWRNAVEDALDDLQLMVAVLQEVLDE